MKKLFIGFIIFAVILGLAATIYASCQKCPYCGAFGRRIGSQRIGGQIVHIYTCGQGHVWQCSW